MHDSSAPAASSSPNTVDARTHIQPQPVITGHSRLSGSARVAALLGLAMLLAGCSIGGSTSSSGSKTALGAQSTPNIQHSTQNASDLQTNVEQVIRTAQPSVVQITSTGGQGGAIGSGEILTQDGYVVTNDHVVRGFSSFSVALASGTTYNNARLVGESPQDDLAVLKVNATGLKPIAIGDSSKVQVGQFAVAIGSPLGLSQSATFGIISALNRPASEGQNGPAQELTGLIQTSAPINPGNSGGALVDLQAQLIGIPTLAAVDPNSGAAANGIGFAIPSNRMQFIAQQLIQNGHVSNTGQGFLGVEGTTVTPELAQANGLPVQSGYIITAFANDASGKSPAKQAGMQTGDIITAVDGQQIATAGDLQAALISKSPGTKVSVQVQRGSSKKTFTVTLGTRPANANG